MYTLAVHKALIVLLEFKEVIGQILIDSCLRAGD